MKEFNLEEHKKGIPICTRCGFPARITETKGMNETYPLSAIITTEDGTKVRTRHRNDGRMVDGVDSDYDLVLSKKEGWINIYYDEDFMDYHPSFKIFGSKELALKNKKENSIYVCTKKISIEWER